MPREGIGRVVGESAHAHVEPDSRRRQKIHCDPLACYRNGTTTYVAEENLEPALAKDPIDHPLLTQFFSSYFQGQYYTHTLN